MKIIVSGQNLEIGQALPVYVEEHLGKKISRYLPTAISAHVVFMKERYLYVCDITIQDGTGNHFHIKTKRSAPEIHQAFDNSLKAIEEQLKRHKSRMKDKHKTQQHAEISKALIGIKYTIDVGTPNNTEATDTSEDNHLILTEKPTDIYRLTLNQAVLKMEAEELPALVFINSATDKMNVIYHRYDGNISWIDTGK